MTYNVYEKISRVTRVTRETENSLRYRMNCHISEIRTGNTSDLFDKHVIKCKYENNVTKEPYFKTYALITLPHKNLLLPYESYFHSLNYDTMN